MRQPAFLAVLILSSALLCSPRPSRADIPVAQLLRSPIANQIIYGQGAGLFARILGVEVSRIQVTNVDLINHALAMPEATAGVRELEARANRVYLEMHARYPEEAEILFGVRPVREGFNHSLHADEMVPFWVREFDPQNWEAVAAGNFIHARENFVNLRYPPVIETPTAALERWAAAGRAATGPVPGNLFGYRKTAVDALAHYHALRTPRPPGDLPPGLLDTSVEGILADETMTMYSANLERTLRLASADGSAISLRKKLTHALTQTLHGRVPETSVAARIGGLAAEGVAPLRRALGEMTVSETRELLHGADPLHPSAESLLGLYLSRTGAQTVVRRFPIGPGAGAALGPERLVVAVSPQSLPAYLELIGRNPHFLLHVHTPQQGTLIVAHEGMAGTYAQLRNALDARAVGTLMPHIALSSAEAQRTTQFFRLGSSAYRQAALTPWSLDGYCARGGYESCTHWFGNLPIGDRLVNEYRFPGAIDEHASNQSPTDPGPRVQALNPRFTPPWQPAGAPNEIELMRLTQRVWQAPGHEQLASVLGLESQNLGAEFANPGWVAYSLLGPASVERVPVVFYVVADHRLPISAGFDLRIHAY